MAYADALKAIEDSSATARTDVETAIAEALKKLEFSSRDASNIISTLEQSPMADAQKWVSTARGQIDQSVGNMLDTMIDLGQRGGFRGGMPGLNTIVESTVNSIIPLTAQLTREAFGTQKELGLKKAGLAENLGLQSAGLLTNKANILSGIETKKGTNLADIYTTEQKELSAIEREKEKIKLALTLGGLATPDSARAVIGSYGISPNISSLYNNGMAGTGTAGSSGGTSRNDSTGNQFTSYGSVYSPLAALNQASAAYDRAIHGGSQGMSFSGPSAGQVEALMRKNNMW